jgi:two-component system, NarL family, nitrate/nitrite response regulator NarL
MTAITVLVVADTRIYRDGLVDALAARGEIDVIGAACGGDEALELMLVETPVVVLCDAASGSGPATVRTVSAGGSSRAYVVALGVVEDEHDIVALAEAGANGFVTRDASVDDLVRIVVRVAGGDAVCTPRIAAVLLGRVAALAAERPEGFQRDLPRLTARELEVVHLIGDGLSNKEIAGRLHVELSTVKNHVHNVLDKLQVRRRADAVARVRAAL